MQRFVLKLHKVNKVFLRICMSFISQPSLVELINASWMESVVSTCVVSKYLEGMMLMLKLQYFGHLMRRVDSLEKTLMLGGIGGRRRRG